MRIAVVGLGYVGTVCSACLAKLGHQVVGVDANAFKVECLGRGQSPIVEAELAELIGAARADGRLSATTSIEDAVRGAALVLVCVGTPSREDGSLDLQHVRRATTEVGRALPKSGTYTVVVQRSTMLPGSVESELVPALEAASGMKAGPDFGVAYNPEFLREGSAVRDFFTAPLTVIGAADERSAAPVRALYQGVGGELVTTSIREAEALKYVNNAFHALKVAFANEIGLWCKREGVDSGQVMSLFVRDARLNVGPAYLKPGFAFGGSCLPKDLRALTHRARERWLELPVIESVMRSNDAHVQHAIQLIERLRKRNIGILGLSFKAETDDLRESPILRVVGSLVGKGYSLLLHDPNVDLGRLLGANRRFVEDEVPYLPELLRSDLEAVLEHGEVLVVGNAAEAYRVLGPRLRAGQTLVDLVRAVDPATVRRGEYLGLAW
jgi:GDP-mannose 6-dehydrogenase